MLRRKTLLLFICFAALCLSAAPATACLFGFHYGNLSSSYDVSTDLFDFDVTQLKTVFDGVSAFSASKTGSSIGSVTGKSPPAADNISLFFWPTPDTGGDFSLSMTISGIVSTPGSESADGSGSFIFTDASSTADTITGDITGTWGRSTAGQNHFSGDLSNVLFNDNSGNGAFDGGTTGSVPMGFSAPIPWYGSAVQITASTEWFGTGEFDKTGGSLSAVVVAVPTPAAILMGMLGLGVVGVKLRKYA